ncbi:MAG: hypothetical protein QMD80_08975 [archaeon]|nr:hypothetical protein [archaeon]
MSKAHSKGIKRFYPGINNPYRGRRMHISTDIDSTFMDFVIFDGGTIKTFKVPSTPQKPAYFEHEGAAIIEGKDSTTVVLLI